MNKIEKYRIGSKVIFMLDHFYNVTKDPYAIIKACYVEETTGRVIVTIGIGKRNIICYENSIKLLLNNPINRLLYPEIDWSKQ